MCVCVARGRCAMDGSSVKRALHVSLLFLCCVVFMLCVEPSFVLPPRRVCLQCLPCLHALIAACPCDWCLRLGLASFAFLSWFSHAVCLICVHPSAETCWLRFDACRFARACFMQCRDVKRALDACSVALCCFCVWLCQS